MKLAEYEKFKDHVLGSMDIEDLKANLKDYSKIRGCDTTYQRAKQIVQDGAFECYYDGVIDVLKTNATVGRSISIRLH